LKAAIGRCIRDKFAFFPNETDGGAFGKSSGVIAQYALPILSDRLLCEEQGGQKKREEKDENSKWHERPLY
jgi:hypothetical protein